MSRKVAFHDGPVRAQIIAQLQWTMQPSTLLVYNESHLHTTPPEAESHFKIVLISDLFVGVSLLMRHRAVNGALEELFKSGQLHAMQLTTKTRDEWEEEGGEVPESPVCLGGT